MVDGPMLAACAVSDAGANSCGGRVGNGLSSNVPVTQPLARPSSQTARIDSWPIAPWAPQSAQPNSTIAPSRVLAIGCPYAPLVPAP